MPQSTKPEPRRVDKPIAGPSPSFIEKLLGKRTGDIELPSDPKDRDPRLKKKRSIFDFGGKIADKISEGTGRK